MLPLLAPTTETLVWHAGQAVTRAGFMHAALQLSARLPDRQYAINLSAGRLAFMLGFAAAALRQQVTLLPPNQTSTALEALKQEYPSQHVIDDDCLNGLDWITPHSGAWPAVDADATIAILFTSGSTGTPQAQAKTWRTLSRTGQLDVQRFVRKPKLNLVATVPSQHMFGLQTTALMPFAGDCAVHDSRPFFPADIRQALESLPAPRALVITPTHLRNCVASKLELPALEFVLSATAPMPSELAQAAETLWQTQVVEIYGSTEAGTMGTRRTTLGDHWQLLPNAHMEIGAEETHYRADHLPASLPLSDRVELISENEFRLLGRNNDQIKIAGKRSSLSELTHALLSVPGVRDGVVFLPEDEHRTAALAVAPGLSGAQILDALAQFIDPVFLPRPLLLVDRLPRNEVGKLVRSALLAALEKT